MSTMHQDESPDLREVGRILRDVLGVSQDISLIHTTFKMSKLKILLQILSKLCNCCMKDLKHTPESSQNYHGIM